MAVQIIENWSKITGIVLSLHPSTELDGFMVANIEVQSVEPVEGFPNLLEEALWKILPVHMPETLVGEAGIKVFDHIECRVRTAGFNRVFVHREYVQVTHPNE